MVRALFVLLLVTSAWAAPEKKAQFMITYDPATGAIHSAFASDDPSSVSTSATNVIVTPGVPTPTDLFSMDEGGYRYTWDGARYVPIVRRARRRVARELMAHWGVLLDLRAWQAQTTPPFDRSAELTAAEARWLALVDAYNNSP